MVTATQEDDYKRLREHAAQMARRTVERLEAGIAQLEVAGEAVTAKSIEAHTVLTFQTIRRNEAAYDLYREHASAFQRSSAEATAGKRTRARLTRSTRRIPIGSCDPLYAYTKRKLVQRVRAAEDRARELEAATLRVAVQQQQELVERMILKAELDATKLRLHQLIGEG